MAHGVLPGLNLDVYAKRRCLLEACSLCMFVKSTRNERFQPKGEKK
jgi:hypothetical protein